MMSTQSGTHRVIPAQLSYFAIYNPSLGPTDETVRDQIVFYYSREPEERLGRQQQEGVADTGKHRQTVGQDYLHHEEAEQHERLRQVGLAQGMVNFVKNFSDGKPLESIETEKARVVLKEVEPQWWILASIDLTQLPIAATAQNTRKTSNLGKDARLNESDAAAPVEYSSREVSPSHLLLAQLVQAYRGFLLHHASSLSELWKKHENNRRLFCYQLDRYWTRFIWNWDVLLHGNPAADLYDAVKLSGGGELGIGVGEEEWGSGEREVLEGFVSRTEGLLDLIVGRYGDAPVAELAEKQDNEPHATLATTDFAPWLGNDEDPRAQDGIIFSGMGGISKRSLITVSKWMESIYMHGEAAYGVGDNPTSRSKRRRKKRSARSDSSRDSDRARKQQREEVHPKLGSLRNKAPDLRRKAMENNAAPPGIPPPLVSAVERSLNDATARAREASQETSPQPAEGSSQKQAESGSLFGADSMMKYLSLGYGSSWTLNPRGFSAAKDSVDATADTNDASKSPDERGAQLQEMDPTPEVSDEETPFLQRLEQSIGKFLVGLSGDLENTEFEDEDDGSARSPEQDHDTGTLPASPSSSKSNRIFLRTLTIEMSPFRQTQLTDAERPSSLHNSMSDNPESAEGKTSAAASVDGAQRLRLTHEKVQVAVYVHQPFIFVFLFQLRTPNLTVPGFYRAIHHTLGPLQKSLLRSTDPERWKDRVREALLPSPDSSANGTPQRELPEIHDLIYDPAKMTLRISIPNIPVPGSLAAEGLHRTSGGSVTVSGSWYTLGIPIGSSTSGPEKSKSALVKSDWTRVEALNVYTHILNLWAATRSVHGTGGQGADAADLERTVKTARGWWVMWMKVRTANSVTPVDAGTDMEAMLVRKSQDRGGGRDTSRAQSGASGSSGRWLLREQPRARDVSGSSQDGYGQNSTGSVGATNAKGVSEGVGVDAKKWVEGLIKLNM
ncbi:hypothetical protein PV08_11561 [Exophiala spinifera]|uniref:CCZ1/INTU/HSP4 first Longin domain-containing protein n=1 Tax=Exophiala spinifera TaxID=91928 RepID=A0A0D1ZC63_9EURO|nr:uncharacterized protein PV08_11561 [Exophiala spinifera]KIW10597.1 hypothetical protein PV08_11561 [Exophiala spinifera]